MDYTAEAMVLVAAEEDVSEKKQRDAAHRTTPRPHSPSKQMCSLQRCPKDTFNMLLFLSLKLVKACYCFKTHALVEQTVVFPKSLGSHPKEQTALLRKC